MQEIDGPDVQEEIRRAMPALKLAQEILAPLAMTDDGSILALLQECADVLGSRVRLSWRCSSYLRRDSLARYRRHVRSLVELESNDWGLPVPEWVSLIHVSDSELASDLPDDLLEYIEDEWYTEYEDDTYRGADIYVSDDQDIAALGLTDEYLTAGNSRTLC